MDASESQVLKALLHEQPVAALATLHRGEPAASMVPFALLPDGTAFVIHVSSLATHTADMLAHPEVALLVTAPLTPEASPLSLPRASVQGPARRLDVDSPGYGTARESYLAKLPDAEDLFEFSDFSLVLIEPRWVRYVAGFGRAMTLGAAQFAAAVSADTGADTGADADVDSDAGADGSAHAEAPGAAADDAPADDAPGGERAAPA